VEVRLVISLVVFDMEARSAISSAVFDDILFSNHFGFFFNYFVRL